MTGWFAELGKIIHHLSTTGSDDHPHLIWPNFVNWAWKATENAITFSFSFSFYSDDILFHNQQTFVIGKS